VNRYPVWGYALIALAIAVAFLYTVPNFFGESPAVQVSSAKSTVKVDTALLGRVEDALKKSSISYTGAQLDPNSVRVRFADIDTQLKARDVIDRALAPDPANSDFSVALVVLWIFVYKPIFKILDARKVERKIGAEKIGWSNRKPAGKTKCNKRPKTIC